MDATTPMTASNTEHTPPAGASKSAATLIAQASSSLSSSDFFDAEHAAALALRKYHASRDYPGIQDACRILREARGLRCAQIIEADRVIAVSEDPHIEELLATPVKSIKPGCYLIEPMLVGADGRELRERAATAKIPVLVIVREPETQLGLWPVVMIGPVTVRARIEPPEYDPPTTAWMLGAAQQLGDAAIASVDLQRTPDRRVDDLIDRLETVIDHADLHDALIETCAEAHAAESSKA